MVLVPVPWSLNTPLIIYNLFFRGFTNREGTREEKCEDGQERIFLSPYLLDYDVDGKEKELLRETGGTEGKRDVSVRERQITEEGKSTYICRNSVRIEFFFTRTCGQR